jgi:hypothetical protein
MRATYGLRLLRDYPDTLDPSSRSAIAGALKLYNEASSTTRLLASTRASLTPLQFREGLTRADRQFQEAAQRVAKALERIPGTIQLSGAMPLSLQHNISMPYPSAVLVLHRETAALNPALLWQNLDSQFRQNHQGRFT